MKTNTEALHEAGRAAYERAMAAAGVKTHHDLLKALETNREARAAYSEAESNWWALVVTMDRVARWEASRASRQWGIPFEDLYQEARIAILSATRLFDPKKGGYRGHCHTWARALVVRYCWLHGNAVRPPYKYEGVKNSTVHASTPLGDLDGEKTLGDTAVFGHDPTPELEEQVDIDTGLEDLSELDRAQVVLRSRGMNDTEIGERLGLTPFQARASLRRAKKALRRTVSEADLVGHDPVTANVMRAVGDGATTARLLATSLGTTVPNARRLAEHARSQGGIDVKDHNYRVVRGGRA